MTEGVQQHYYTRKLTGSDIKSLILMPMQMKTIASMPKDNASDSLTVKL